MFRKDVRHMRSYAAASLLRPDLAIHLRDGYAVAQNWWAEGT